MTLPLGGVIAAPAAPAGAPEASDEARKAAEGFERLMVGELAKALVHTAEAASPGDEDGAGAPGLYADMIPDALTEALMSAGGIGLARQLQERMA